MVILTDTLRMALFYKIKGINIHKMKVSPVRRTFIKKW